MYINSFALNSEFNSPLFPPSVERFVVILTLVFNMDEISNITKDRQVEHVSFLIPCRNMNNNTWNAPPEYQTSALEYAKEISSFVSRYHWLLEGEDIVNDFFT